MATLTGATLTAVKLGMTLEIRLSFVYLFALLARPNFVSLQEFCTGNQCDSNDVTSEFVNRYTKEANTKHLPDYSEEINKALAEYEACVQSNCSCHLKTLKDDLEPFRATKISKAMLESVKTKGTKYQIISGKLYRDADCLFPARCSGIEHFILKFVGKLPDLEMIINTRDWPQMNKNWGGGFAPVFSFSKTKDYWDIMYPTWSFWEGGPAIKLYPTGLGKWNQHRKSLSKAAEKWTWDEKKPLAFFRGSRTSEERDPIVLLSRSNPDLVDASYTKNQAWKSDADTLHAPPAEEVSLEDHCQYKYLFNYRGVAASFRFKHLFLCKSLVFHVGDEWLEFFYPSLKPWVHYVPVSTKATKDDLKQMIEYFIEHDNTGRSIAERGFQHIWDHLRIADVNCYWKRLLKDYAKLLNYKITRDERLIEIKQSD